MSQESQSDSYGRMYGPPRIGGHDRHIQSIIDHTSSLFPDPQYRLPQFTPSTNRLNGQGLTSALSGNTPAADEYAGLDDFVLGRSQPTQHTPSIKSLSSASDRSQRLSLPLNASASRPSRVLGDASHHFKPFVPRDPSHRSSFQSDLYHHDIAQERDPSPTTQRFQYYTEYPTQEHWHQPSLQSEPAWLESSETASPMQSILHRNSTYRVGEFQRGTQLFTPIFHNATKSTPSLKSSLTSSSPLNAGQSSPSTRLSLARQRPVANRTALVPKWNQKLQLDLDHAHDLPPIVNNTRLVDPRQALPDKFRAIFPYQLFNAVQSKCFPLVYGTNDNAVISAPTGSGKTAILEMAICKLVSNQGGGNFKVVYQAPTKSLCSEKARDWQKKFSHMNLQCVELTGDTSQAEARRVGSASIIVTTPEKWDSITRKWKDHRKLLDLVRLVLIDEVHILKDTRGATLEAVVSRMKTIEGSIRFVALSATVPNIDDVAKWLGRNHNNQNEPARYEVFGEELRPVKLQRYVYGYEGGPNDFIFEKMLDGKLNLLLSRHSERKPIMVFCITRKSCERTARTLAEWWSTCRANDKAWQPPTNRIPVVSPALQEIVRFGVAFHHAGLDVQDRAAVEMNFLNGQLHVICCTSTLAVGVNLPCHTVVLKGTSTYSDNGPQEYSDLEITQMLGRAGRPQFDSSAVAIIMTRSANVQRYEKLISGEELLESTLHRNLLEHINSEIGLGTIQDIHTAKKWIGGTFLSVRVRQSPSLYKLDNVQNAAGADERMEEWCERDVRLLQDYELVTKHTPFVCTEYGHAMSRYMVQFETMKLLLSIPRAADTEKMLTMICQAAEFKDFRFKPAERAVFREMNKSTLVLYPMRETLTFTWHKIFMIVQIHLGGVELPTDKDVALNRQDLLREKRVVFDRLNRLVRCVIDCKAFDGDGQGVKVALELARSIAANAWENKPAQLSQIPGFGPVAVRKWASHGVSTVLDIAGKNFLDIERIASRNPPYGRDILKILENFPRLTLKADIIESKAASFNSDEPVSVTLKVRLGHCNVKAVPYWNDRVPALTFIALTSDGNLAYLWRGNMKRIEKSIGLDLRFPVALTAPKQTIFCHFSCEEIVGTQVTKTLEPNIPTSAFRSIKSHSVQPTLSHGNLPNSEEDYDDIPDELMLEALSRPRRTEQQNTPECLSPLDHVEDNFPLIDELLSQGDTLPETESARMHNGRWMCNHHCRNGGYTKSGKPCNHRCCREGLEKYRPPPPLKKPSGPSSKWEGSELLKNNSDNSGSPHKLKPGSGKINRPSRPRLTAGSGNDIKHSDYLAQPCSKAKRAYSSDGARILGGSTTKRPRLGHLNLASDFLSDIEYVDLSNISDDDSKPLTSCNQPSTISQLQRQKLLHHQRDINSDVTASLQPIKSYNAETNPFDDERSCDASDEEEGVIPYHNSDPLSTSSQHGVSSDMDDEMSDLPDLEGFLCSKERCEPPTPIQTASPQKTWESDETLFTTVDELQKASHRFGLPSTSATVWGAGSRLISSAESPRKSNSFGSSSSLPEFGTTSANTPQMESMMHSPSQGENDSATVTCPIPREQPEDDSRGSSQGLATRSNEPAWVADFDPELIDSLRSVVNFID
ncbi:P-loop containing nucleoside triphosphate hydrolase protein [Xylariaceae sp. FL1651]|nr:P-loop containing nucleoside triphosphate hydrolase protein [Xylariaceae sp. FL1651]